MAGHSVSRPVVLGNNWVTLTFLFFFRRSLVSLITAAFLLRRLVEFGVLLLKAAQGVGFGVTLACLQSVYIVNAYSLAPSSPQAAVATASLPLFEEQAKARQALTDL